MLKFEAPITSANGEITSFHIHVEITENGLEGEMLWGGKVHPILHIHATPAQNSMYCQLMWMGVYQRTNIVAEVNGEHCSISIRPLGGVFDYGMSKSDYQAYVHFLRKLDLDNPFPLSIREDPIRDAEMNDLDVGLKSLNLYLGSNLYKNLPMRFTACSVNEISVSVAFPHRLPQELGSFLPLGLFKTGKVVALEWSFETADVTQGAKAAVGAFRGDTLRDRTVLELYSLDAFRSYKGQANVIV